MGKLTSARLEELLAKLCEEVRKLPEDEIEYFLDGIEEFNCQIGCPYCGNEEINSADYYGYDVSTCKKCGGFFRYTERSIWGAVKLGASLEEAVAAGNINLDYNPFGMG